MTTMKSWLIFTIALLLLVQYSLSEDETKKVECKSLCEGNPDDSKTSCKSKRNNLKIIVELQLPDSETNTTSSHYYPFCILVDKLSQLILVDCKFFSTCID